jgi:hypothetical protein
VSLAPTCGAVLMWPCDFELKAIAGSNCRTIQTKFNPDLELSSSETLIRKIQWIINRKLSRGSQINTASPVP